MNWTVFAEVIVWSITVTAGGGAFFALMLLLTEPYPSDMSVRRCVKTAAICSPIAVLGIAVLSGKREAIK